MLTQDNFTKENIERLQKISGNDPSLLEKTVYAFGLLEAISKGWEGKKSAWLALVGFAIILFNLIVVNLVIAGLHSYASS